jgi:hypothetical protein
MGVGIPKFGTWAVAEVDFPAGGNPWNGQPVIVAPSGDIFTPDTFPPAEYFNYLFNLAFVQDVVLLSVGGLGPARNWHTPFTDSAGTSGDLVWNQAVRRWMMVWWNGSNSMNADYYSGGDQVRVASGATAQAVAAIPGPSACGSDGVLYTMSGGTLFGLSGTTWSTVRAPFITASACAVATIGTAWALVVNDTSGAGWQYWSGASLAAGTKILDQAGTSPTNGWAMASNGATATLVCFVERAASGVVYTASTSAIVSTTNLTTFLGSTDVPLDITWDSTNSRWLMAVSVAGGTTTAFWYSSDGVHWTKASQLTSMRFGFTAIGGVNLRAIGALIAATAFDTVATFALCYSTDGGVTWNSSDTLFAGSSSTSAQLRASDVGFAIVYPNETTNQLQFSDRFGVPTAQLS